jgi:hypothetical protein
MAIAKGKLCCHRLDPPAEFAIVVIEAIKLPWQILQPNDTLDTLVR